MPKTALGCCRLQCCSAAQCCSVAAVAIPHTPPRVVCRCHVTPGRWPRRVRVTPPGGTLPSAVQLLPRPAVHSPKVQSRDPGCSTRACHPPITQPSGRLPRASPPPSGTFALLRHAAPSRSMGRGVHSNPHRPTARDPPPGALAPKPNVAALGRRDGRMPAGAAVPDPPDSLRRSPRIRRGMSRGTRCLASRAVGPFFR